MSVEAVQPEDPMERAAARLATSQRPSLKLRESDDVASPVKDHKQSKADLAAQRREVQDDEGKIPVYYGDDIETFVDPEQFDIEFQLMCENGTPARALMKLIGAEEMKKFMRLPVMELEKILQSFAKQAGVGNF